MRTTGTVDWYDAVGGVGCITPDDGSSGCFVHQSAVTGNGSLTAGTKVEFDIVEKVKGSPAAERVVVLSVPPPASPRPRGE